MATVPISRPAPAQQGLTASAVKMDPRSSTFVQRRTLTWQKQAFLFVKLIPELQYASLFYAKMLSKLKIYPAFRLPNDDLDPITEGAPLEALDRIQDPGGGRSHIQYSYGNLMFIVGEGFLFGHDLGKDEEAWRFVSSEELEFADRKIVWRPTEQGTPRTFTRDSDGVAYRMWTPDPERSGEPTSPVRSAIEIAEELDILTKAVRSTAVTRMLRGILKIPQELSFGSEEPGQEDDPETIPLLRKAIEHFSGVVENAGSPEAALPWFIEGADEFLENLKWENTHDPQTDYLEKDLRKEAIERLAMGLDMPPEMLKGLANANHWGSRQIVHDAWRTHGVVVAERMCDDFAEAYLRPALREAKFDRWKEVVIGYDDSNVVVAPDRTDDADRAFDRGTVGRKGHRQMKGVSEALAPDEEEFRIYLAIKLKEPGFLQGTKWALPEPDPAPQEPGPDPSGDEDHDAEDGPDEPRTDRGVSREESRTSAIQAAATLAVMRCRELAGSRIRSQLQRKSDPVIESVDGHPNADVAALVGQDAIRSLSKSDPLKLVQGGTESFVCYLTDEWGFTDAQATALSEMLTVWSARTLFERKTPALPPGFVAQVERMQEVASVLSEKANVERNNEALRELSTKVPGGLTIGV